ncbi:MAG: Hsp70 family protein [Myxococcaceae bacterium]|nr:Hsp70 family protein [Myxococcaceae bacterium]
MAEPTIGIDLGTTYSAVATMVEGRPQLILNRGGGRLTPSMVGFLPDGERVVGERARALVEHSPESVAFAAKRFIGRKWTPEIAADAKEVVPYPVVAGPQGECRIKIAGRVVPVTQISAMILGELKLDAEAYFGRHVSHAVITVPANFDDGQRAATKEAARIAGLEVMRIINEPTAAAVAYGLDKNFTGRALVFDLGGGTFDVSILEIKDGVYEVRATGGDAHLGGEDFDNRIVQWLIAQVPEPFREAVAKDRLSLQKLKIAAEKAKRELTDAVEAYLSIQGIGDHGEVPRLTDLETALTRQFFEILSRPLSERCLAVCEQVMAEAKLDPQSMDAVLLVGGMTRVPLVQQLVADFFGKEPVPGLNPDEVVALGAAVHADEVMQQSGRALLIDVAAHSLGVGVLGGKVKRLINKNTSVPCSAREIFLPGQHGQSHVRIPIYQGDSDYQDENRKLGEVSLQHINAVDRSQAPIEVVFELGTDGMLSVRATDLKSGTTEALRIEARNTELSPQEEQKLTRDQAKYAEQQSLNDAERQKQLFERMLEKSEKLVRMLDQSANENPSEEARAAVASVRTLVDLGRAALKANNLQQIAEVRNRLSRLVR